MLLYIPLCALCNSLYIEFLLKQSTGCFFILDAGSTKLIREIAPSVKVAVAGCFEEGVKVMHGCNNSWYLFNEGMHWGPWYPSNTHSLRPAVDEEDWCGIVAVPHLTRDLVLSYEGRNDFFATHPGNVQRAQTNQGLNCPYMYNLVDQHRLQEDYNNGFSYCHIFVGAGWLEPNHNVADSEEICQKLYYDFLAYFVELRNQGACVDMTMGEFSNWYKENMSIGKSQVALAKDILYDSKKQYFWYIDPYMRVTLDANQAGSICDLRPYAGQLACTTGPDSKDKCYGSYPYVIHSQYRSGAAHHFEDGARTTLKVIYGEEKLDLCTCRTYIKSVDSNEEGTHVKFSPAKLTFSNGLTCSLETVYHFKGKGNILLERRLLELSDPTAVIRIQEYVKGCYGITEYPENMEEIKLQGRQ